MRLLAYIPLLQTETDAVRIIKLSKEGLRGICMWNNEYLLVGCDGKKIKLIDFNNGKIIKEIEGHNDKVLSLKLIFHPIISFQILTLYNLMGLLLVFSVFFLFPLTLFLCEMFRLKKS